MNTNEFDPSPNYVGYPVDRRNFEYWQLKKDSIKWHVKEVGQTNKLDIIMENTINVTYL